MARAASDRVTAPVGRRVAALDLHAPAAQLVLAALSIITLFGALLVAPFPLWASQPARPPIAGAPPTQPVGWPGWVLIAAFVLAMCLPFRPYRLAQRALGHAHAQVSTRLIVGLTALLALVSLLIYPAFGSDLFDYVGFERMFAIYADNPLTALPANHPADWSTPLVWYPTRTPAYGPLWAILTWPLVRLAGDSIAGEVAAYKLLSLGAYAGCAWAVWHAAPPTRRQRALVTFAWSPLVLFEVLGKVHNDILPALAAAVAVWLVGSSPRARLLSLVAAVAGGLVKATALAVVPVLALTLWRRGGWRALLPALLAAVALAVALYAPFWVGLSTFASIWNQTGRVVWSPASVLLLASGLLPGGPFDAAVRLVLALTWVGVVCYVMLRVRSSRSASAPETLGEVATGSGWILLATLLLLTSALFAHYLVPLIVLSVLSTSKQLERLVLWLSLGGLAAYGVELLALVLGSQWLGSDGSRLVGSAVLLGPAVLALTLPVLSLPTQKLALTRPLIALTHPRPGTAADTHAAQPAAAQHPDAERHEQHDTPSYVD